jgi:hypothetical protein
MMPSKDPEVKRRAQERYRASAKGKARRKAAKKAWDQSEAGRAMKLEHDKTWRQTLAYKALAAKKARELKAKRKAWLIEQKSGLCCAECGYDKHPAALQFHHVDENTKVGNVSKMVATPNVKFEVILIEIAKCIVLCANCHAIHHEQELRPTTPASVQAKYVRDHRAKRKEWLRKQKLAISCEDCGFNDHPVALQFHHVDATDKVSEVSRLLHSEGRSLDVIASEIAKCDVLCANCHAIHHYEEHKLRQSAA